MKKLINYLICYFSYYDLVILDKFEVYTYGVTNTSLNFLVILPFSPTLNDVSWKF